MLRDYVPSFVEQAESPAKNLCLGTLHEHILNLVRKATLPTEYLSLDNIEDDDASDVEGAILLPPDQVKRRTFPRITIFVCMFLLTTAWPVYYATSTLLSHLYWKSEASSITSALLEELYGGLKIPIGQETFTTPSQETYSVPQVHWNQPLGKQVLILDVDTRPLNGSGQYLQDPSSSWDLMDSRATGLLNHYLYSQIHGYEYTFLRADVPPSLAAFWVKITTLKEKLKDYRIIVFMDADALWNYPEIPLEWLMNHWGITPNLSLAISTDPPRNRNVNGDAQSNTGFIIAQQNARTMEMIDTWLDCPTGKRFPGCERYAWARFHEQQAFNDYVRYDFNRSTDYILLPANETNGFAGSDIECEGVFVSHYWSDKSRPRIGFGNSVMRALAQELNAQLLAEKERFVEDHSRVEEGLTA